MQLLNNIPTDYIFTMYFKPIYEMYSVKSLPRTLMVDNRLGRMLNIVHCKSKLPTLKVMQDNFRDRHIRSNVASHDNRCFIAFSGGKDCLATAIRAEQEGYKPTLVYVSGVNKSLPSERKHAIDVAHKAGYPIKEIKINISGNKDYNEHPLKNILILCLLIDLGLKSGVSTFGLGNIFEENSVHGSLDYDLSDSYDIIGAFNHFVKGVFPNYKYLKYIHDNMQSFYTVYNKDKGLIPLLSSCITPDYRKPMIQRANQKKFGKECVPDGFCGSCYKCADYYLYRQSFGMIRSNKEYSKKCLEAKAKFDKNYTLDVEFDKKKYNRWGGYDTEEVQVLCDRCGYYIGRLIKDKKLYKWFVHQYYGNKHYPSRAIAEKVCRRFKTLYNLS